MLEGYGRKCRKQPLGTKEHAECIRKLSESIILQCIEDLWDKASMKQSAKFFSQKDFSICANIAGMDICDQVKLLDIVNCAIFRLRNLHRGSSPHARTRVPSVFRGNTMKRLRTAGEAGG
ncbi:MAG: hypothetical protein HZB62_05780 [Nitrospirae bacterium]|nr:hypothetical protein [Nitrospirota bacterium]